MLKPMFRQLNGTAVGAFRCAALLALTALTVTGCERDGAARPDVAAETEFPSSFEFPIVHPQDSTPDGRRALQLDSFKGTLAIAYLDGSTVTRREIVKVGMQPVSVRAASNGEAWVVDPIADSISIVDLDSATVTATLQTAPQPTDVMFSGLPSLAYVTVAHGRTLLVFDPLAPDEPLTRIALQFRSQSERDDI